MDLQIVLMGVAVVVAAVFGFLIALLIKAKQLAALKAQLSQQVLTATELQTKLASTSEAEQRLNQTISDLKTELSEAQQKHSQTLTNQYQAEKQFEAAQASYKAAQEQLAELKQTLAQKEAQWLEQQNRYQSLSNEHTELQTSLKEKEEHFKQQLKQLTDAEAALTKEFENIANKVFEQKNKSFTEASQNSLGQILKPLGEQIERFEKRVNEVHDASTKGNANLSNELSKVLEIGLQMSKEASNLTSALKGDSQKRGAWGEAQLRRTLEMSGLVEGDHYDDQSSFKDADGKTKRTDFLVKLPDGKHIIIDSKVTLDAYDRLVSAESPEAHALAMKDHLQAVRNHIDDLAKKDYTNVIGVRSPNFVLMFMPIEPAYIEALKSDKGLFEYGYKKGIVLVSHTTLIPILRTVSNLWMIARSNEEARKISEHAGDIYNQVCLVSERLEKLGNSLNAVSSHYNDTVTALVGKQGLHGKVRRFEDVSIKISRSLPDLEHKHIDFDVEKLSAIESPENMPQLPDQSEG